MSNRASLLRRLTIAATLVALGLNGLPLALGWDFERLQQRVSSRFGAGQLPLLHDWQRTLGEGRSAPETDKLKRINDFFNQRIAFDDDTSVWGQNDYWATPSETIGQGGGDLSPIFSFNSAGSWQGTDNQSSQSNLSRWQDLQARAHTEGFQ